MDGLIDGQDHRDIYLWNYPQLRLHIFGARSVGTAELIRTTNQYVFDIDPVAGVLTSRNHVRAVFDKLTEFIDWVTSGFYV